MNEYKQTLYEIVDKSFALDKYAIARVISIFENETMDSIKKRKDIITYINKVTQKQRKVRGCIIGMTGTPGVGKSSLLGAICQQILAKKPDISIAVLAVDPSSSISGGALLGDRIRTRFPTKDDRIFFRSQATENNLGGLGRHTFQVSRVLQKLFDVLFIETVGIGQNEIEIHKLSDLTCLVMQPSAGDEIQFIKSGIMEIPDVFIMNKCDQGINAVNSANHLEKSLSLFQINSAKKPTIFMTSVLDSDSLTTLVDYLHTFPKGEFILKKTQLNECKRNMYFLHQEIYHQYGTFGLHILEHSKVFSDRRIENFDAALEEATHLIKKHVS